MNPIARLLIALAVLCGLLVHETAAAEDVVIEDAALSSLGVAFASPRPATAAGVVEARAYVIVPPASDHIVSSTVGGLVSGVYVGVGDAVAAGTPLISIRSPDFLMRQQEYLEARQQSALATAALERDEQLAAEGIIAGRRLQETRAEAVAAAARYAEHEQLLRLAGLRQRDIDRLADSGGLLDTLVLRAPVEGVVLAVDARTGERVEAVSALARVADPTTLWLDIRVPRERLGDVGVGVDVVLPGTGATAVVRAIGRAVDPATQMVPVRAELTAAGDALMPGQLVAVRISAARTHAGTVALPPAAIVRSGDAAFVFVRTADGVTATPVRIEAPGDPVVVRGLSPSDRVAVAGVSALKALWLAEGEGTP